MVIWTTGAVKRIADGLADKRSSRAKKILPAAGAVLWAWDADPSVKEAAGEQWVFLLPDKWNPSTQGRVYSWRYRSARARHGIVSRAGRKAHAYAPCSV